MTIPQLMAALDAGEKLRIEAAIFASDAVYNGVAPTVSEQGVRVSREWRRKISGLLE